MTTYSIREHETKKPQNDFRTGSLIGAIIGVILLVATMLVAHTHQLTGLNARVFHFFNNGSNSFKTLALWITEGLGAAYPIAACVIIPLLFKKYRAAWRFFFTVGGAFVAAYIVKKLVNEPRPIAMIHHLHQRAIETGPGFPSAHETAATAMALTLWFFLPAKWRFVPVIWILAVAWSRLYLGVHTPVDVIGGFAIGLLAVCIVRLLPKIIAKPLRLDDEA